MLFLLVFSPELAEERMGKGAGQKVIYFQQLVFTWVYLGFDKVLDILTNVGYFQVLWRVIWRACARALPFCKGYGRAKMALDGIISIGS